MSVTLSAPVVQQAPARQVARQLARVEARRVALHPATLLGLALAIWAMWGLNRGGAPVLSRAGANTSLPLALIGAGGLIAVSEVAVRMWKTEQSEAMDIAPASPRTRTVALLGAAVTPVLLAVVLQLTVLGLMILDRPVTTLDWWDALAGPATVALLTGAGVAAGRWAPSRFTGPLMLIALVGESIYVSTYQINQSYGQWVRWLSPVVPLEFDPVELAFRPTGRHLLYLTGWIGLFVSLALLRGRAHRIWVPTAALLVSMAVIATAAGSEAAAHDEFDPDRLLRSYLLPDAEFVCEERSTVTYCAYPEYQPWIAEWAAVVGPVLQLAPDAVRDRQLEIRQYPTRAFDLLFDYGDPPVTKQTDLATGMWWGRQAGGTANGEWGDSYPFGMALGAASWAVGLPLESVAGKWEETYGPDGEITSSGFVPGTEDVPSEEVSYTACTTTDEGRAVVALWMASQASPVTEQHLRNQIEHPNYPLIESQESHGETHTSYQGLFDTLDVAQPYPWYALEFQMREAYYAYQLLDRAQSEVAALIRANWTELTDPSTTTLQALSILEIEPLEGFEAVVAESEDFYWQYPPCE
ncbi:MAG: hypothetical protein ACRDWS_02780 [Acidimicrobiia bacterium]